MSVLPSLVNDVGTLMGIAGSAFGFWSYLKEKRTRSLLSKKQHELDRVLSRMNDLSQYADGLKNLK